MSTNETNIFPIENLGELRSDHRLYKIRGLSGDSGKYDPNLQSIIKKLSFELRTPVTVIFKEAEPYLVLPVDAPEPPSPLPLVRATAYFDKTDQTITLDYERLDETTAPIATRFLQFAIEGAFYRNLRFWQPSAGNPFFEREPVSQRSGLAIFRGAAVRVVQLDHGKLGLCVDVQHKYVSANPLPAKLPRADFRRFKNTHCIYHFGSRWYEIRLHDHTGLSLAEQMITNGSGTPTQLHKYILEHVPQPLSKEVLDLQGDSVALSYMTSRNEVRWAAGALCYPVIGTSDSRMNGAQREATLIPHVRRREILTFVGQHLRRVQLNGRDVKVAQTPIGSATNLFLPPDLSFGGGSVYSVRGTKGARYVGLDRLGEVRLAALFNRKEGPFVQRPLDRQYFIVPKSVADSYGPAFLKDLSAVVSQLLPVGASYTPALVTYEDLGAKTYAVQGKAILAALETLRDPGFGIVMLHETTDRRIRQHDQLASMVMREARKREVFVSVIHSTLSKQCYQLARSGSEYEQTTDRKLRGRLSGYLRNVALTKVLLTNERWPFVLNTPLHAELTIAIDVQLHTACFTFIGQQGPDIRTMTTTSTQKERLDAAHVRKVIRDTLHEEFKLGRKPIGSLVIQRDGRLFATELSGIKEAFAQLKQDGVVAPAASLNFVEISKSAPAPFRIFSVEQKGGAGEQVMNPQVGSYFIANARDGYVCSTGREFRHPGTAKPLHVHYVEGTFSFAQILEDVYAQTCLAWTRPEDCTRYPVTIKLGDIRLTETAGGYDPDAIQYADDSAETAGEVVANE